MKEEIQIRLPLHHRVLISDSLFLIWGQWQCIDNILCVLGFSVKADKVSCDLFGSDLIIPPNSSLFFPADAPPASFPFTWKNSQRPARLQ